MPIQYDTAQPVEEPKTANEVHITGCNIRVPRDGDKSASWYLEAVDADGSVVDRKPMHLTLEELQTKYPNEFAAVYSAIKTIGYAEAQERGLFPEGTVS